MPNLMIQQSYFYVLNLILHTTEFLMSKSFCKNVYNAKIKMYVKK